MCAHWKIIIGHKTSYLVVSLNSNICTRNFNTRIYVKKLHKFPKQLNRFFFFHRKQREMSGFYNDFCDMIRSGYKAIWKYNRGFLKWLFSYVPPTKKKYYQRREKCNLFQMKFKYGKAFFDWTGQPITFMLEMIFPEIKSSIQFILRSDECSSQFVCNICPMFWDGYKSVC